MMGTRHTSSSCAAIVVALSLGALSTSGCTISQEQVAAQPHSVQREQLALEVARNDYQRRFPVEYTIATWEIIIIEKQGNLWVMFANPIPEASRASLGDVPRSGRLFILSADGSSILDTMIM
jgi:hypothetical protein